MDRKNQYKLILFTNLIAWALISLDDFLEDMYHFKWLVIFVLLAPFIVVAVYLTLDHELNPVFCGKRFVLFMIRYLVVGVLVASPIIILASENKWVVRRIYDEWSGPSRGFYYFMFGYILVFGCEIVFVFYAVIRSIRKKYETWKRSRTIR